jgi:hypothetical protein
MLPEDVVIANECMKLDVLLFQNVKEVTSAFSQRNKVDVLASVKKITKLNDSVDAILFKVWNQYCRVEFFVELMKVFGVITNTKMGVP